jgi:hypothetical protein
MTQYISYSDRDLHSVVIGPISFSHDNATGRTFASTDVTVNLYDSSGKVLGPSITANVGFDADKSLSFQDAEREAVNRAHMLLARISKVSAEGLLELHQKGQEFVMDAS